MNYSIADMTQKLYKFYSSIILWDQVMPEIILPVPSIKINYFYHINYNRTSRVLYMRHYYNTVQKVQSKLPPTKLSFLRKSFAHKLGKKGEAGGASSHDPDGSLTHVTGLQLFASRRQNHSLYTGGSRRQLRKKKKKDEEAFHKLVGRKRKRLSLWPLLLLLIFFCHQNLHRDIRIVYENICNVKIISRKHLFYN